MQQYQRDLSDLQEVSVRSRVTLKPKRPCSPSGSSVFGRPQRDAKEIYCTLHARLLRRAERAAGLTKLPRTL